MSPRTTSGKPVQKFRGKGQKADENNQATEALRREEERYRNILETISDGYYEVDLKGNLTFFNNALLRIHGRSPEELTGLNNRSYTSPDTAKKVFNIYNEMYRTGNLMPRVIDYEIIRKDGSVIWTELSTSLMTDVSGKMIGFRGIVRDRTDQKKAEKALKESEEKYRNILENIEEGYYEVDLKGDFTFSNNALARIHGRPPEEMLGLNNRFYNTPETSKRIFRIFNDMYRSEGAPARIIDYEIIRKDGSIVLAEFSVSLMKDPSGKTIGFRGIVRDRTLQKKAETALAASEEKYRLLIENAHDAIFILQDGMMKFVNPKTETLTGFSAKDLATMPFDEMVHPLNKQAFADRQHQMLAGSAPRETFSFQMINRKEEILWVELDTVAVSWESRPATLNFLHNVTAQRKLEFQLLQAQKMEAVGTLAGGIAHDFNNLLMAILGNTSLILLDTPTDHPHWAKLKNIETEIKSGAALTRQLLGVAKGGKFDVRPADINKLIAGVLNLFCRTRKDIRIHTMLPQEIWTVEVDQNQINQVLLNLYVNAAQAMPAGGDLYVQTQNITLDEHYTSPLGLSAGKFVRISVTDTGIGMDEDTRKKAFDPFFTTKGMSMGTGLGLASAYGIVKNHNGIINVYSEKGQGSTFNIYLPASEKSVIWEKMHPSDILRGTETILFVDDQPSIVDAGRGLLEGLGYHVITAESGKQAIDIFTREKDRIDAVILDMIMPEMSGGEAFDRLRQIAPQVKVLLSSGYSINGQAQKIIDRGCGGFLQKPFNLEDLSQKLRQILDGKSA